ncbi:SusC/RagA family TonB-linked outer membrane protein [Flavihumibacter sp. UBA7668]|uniref:SusC/RagA family TonB-linked outer membrane protein n=1 Tax=Flavihumibacter sp. UBA7668 TaxID=1946542 RepID=UPI0025BB47B2|nr:TonB-dependent receptor [Flavihumibacter sp. UBA7668]
MRKLVLLLLGILMLGGELLAQSRTVTGKVSDALGKPVPNASILVKGSSIGTSTLEDGSFSINVPENSKTLVITAVGMLQREINITNKNTVSIDLQTDNRDLQEVVVVGYGVQKKRTVTAAIGKIGGDKISDLPTTSFDRQLAGRAAGVQVTQSSGLVSAPPRIRIRGVNSISQGRDPLFVIDGVPSYTGGASSFANTNVLADINPNDIESIEVLKDGAATAIYGSRAANGVVMITTKKGKSGRLNVNYDMYMGVSSEFNSPDLLNGEQFVTIANEKLTNAGLAAGANMSAEGTNTDWLRDVIYKKNPFVQSHTISAAGGSDKSTYYMSLNYLSQEGIIQTNKNRRFNVRANMEHKANKWLKIGNNITLSRTEDFDQNNGGNALSGAMGAAQRALPNVRVFNADHPTGYNITPDNSALGSDANTRNIENNYVNIAYVLAKNKFSNDRYRIINNFFLELSPIRSVQIRTQASVDYTNSIDFQSLDRVHGDGRGAQGSLTNQNIQYSIYTWQNYATWTEQFGDHGVTAVGGVEMQRVTNRSFFGQGTTISDPFFQSDNLISNTIANQFSGGGITKTGFQSYFGRLNYDYAGKYFAQFSIRRDGSSRLAPDVRYGNFFGASAGWNISAEKFWSQSGIANVINDFKIRGGYAEVGNELSASFPWLSTYGPAQYGGVAGNAANRIGNAQLQWEVNKKLNLGVDLAFLDDRFNLSFDYFINQNDGQVLDELQPVSLGVPGNIITKNIGKMENKGIEISIGGDIIRKKDFTWAVNANFTKVANKVKALADGQQEVLVAGPNNGTFNINRIGSDINSFYGYEWAGVNPANGNPMWYRNGSDTIVQYHNVAGAAANYYLFDPSKPNTLGDATTLGNRSIIGSALPTWFGGISNTVTYKRFTVDVFFRFGGGNSVYNLTRQEVWNSMGFVNNGTEVLNRWTPDNTAGTSPKLYYGRDNQVNLQGLANSRFLEKANFLRLQNLQLGYSIDTKKLGNLGNTIKSARFFVQGTNLFVWTNYNGIDPENFSEIGIDNSSVPQLRTFTFGLNLGF